MQEDISELKRIVDTPENEDGVKMTVSEMIKDYFTIVEF